MDVKHHVYLCRVSWEMEIFSPAIPSSSVWWSYFFHSFFLCVLLSLIFKCWTPAHHKQKWISSLHFLFHCLTVVKKKIVASKRGLTLISHTLCMCIVILDKCCFKKICVLIYNIFRLVYEEGEVLECGKQPVHSWERERGRRGVETGWTRWREWRVGGQWWWGGGGGGMFTIISSLGQSKPGRMYPGCLVPCCTVLIKKQTSPVWNVCCGGKWCLHHFHQEWDTRKWRHFCCCYVADILCQSTYIIIRDCYKEQKTNVLTIHHVHATHTHTHTHTHNIHTPAAYTASGFAIHSLFSHNCQHILNLSADRGELFLAASCERYVLVPCLFVSFSSLQSLPGV